MEELVELESAIKLIKSMSPTNYIFELKFWANVVTTGAFLVANTLPGAGMIVDPGIEVQF